MQIEAKLQEAIRCIQETMTGKTSKLNAGILCIHQASAAIGGMAELLARAEQDIRNMLLVEADEFWTPREKMRESATKTANEIEQALKAWKGSADSDG